MAARRSTGKRLRFAVFDRDHYTCQYCGRQPPDVVLVADHIEPVRNGGATTIDNLITACEACNQGKADHAPGYAVPRPDADQLYLQTQQEIAELRRFQDARQELDAELDRTVTVLQDTWRAAAGSNAAPGNRLVRALLTRYGIEVTDAAIADVAYKVGTGYISNYSDRWLPYLNKVAATMYREWDEDDD